MGKKKKENKNNCPKDCPSNNPMEKGPCKNQPEKN